MRTVHVLVIAFATLLGTLPPAAAEERGLWQTLKNDPQCAVWNGSPHHQDTFTWSGPCVDGKAHGRSVMVWSFVEGGAAYEIRYEGDMRGGRWHGWGVYTSPNGGRYIGERRDDDPHGQGVYTWPDGSRYEGKWRGGKWHGWGVYTSSDGSRHEGEWSDEYQD